ncbi:glycosyltransferase [Ruminococcus sp.]|uniref:glycosyltransferase n=1 Tax=Ruminococcus sp. TaxID=41978 RepID=UPI0026081C71|nr:glycosyltransferase [Ruminococcus sp.]MDD7556950.1 glycosyltransferase [Ruminococcus sp.]MDY4963510.1 glycosyltransferase [Ruminococcus callidus]
MAGLRILQVNKFYPPHIGGIETVIQQVSQGLKDRAEVSVLVCQPKGRGVREVCDGVPVTRCSSWRTVASCPVSFSFFREFRRMAKEADVIECHLPFPLADLACLLSRTKKRVVIAWHSDVVKQKKLLALYKPILRAFLRRADAIIVATQGHIDGSAFLPPFRDKCVVIPYGIPTAEYLQAPAAPILTEKLRGKPLRKLLFVGRLVYYKGVDVLLRAFARTEGCALFLAGEGVLEPQLRQEAQTLGVADRVFFLGRLTDAQLRAAFRDCDFFVLPSVANSEAFGIVQLEAMVYGKPVINTALPTGVPLVSIHGETGLTVPPGDETALADAIRTLAEDDALREAYGAAAQRRVLEHFELDNMIDGVYRVLAEGIPPQERGMDT